MKIDVAKSPLANLVGLLVEVNPGKTVTAAQVTVGAPSVLTGDASGKNSSVTFTAVEGQGKAGSVTLKYDRLGLNSGVAVPVTEVAVTVEDDDATSLAKVIAALGLVASEVDSSDFTKATDSDTDGSITLTPKANSALYVGEEIVILLQIPAAPAPELDAEFTNTTATGFEPVTV